MFPSRDLINTNKFLQFIILGKTLSLDEILKQLQELSNDAERKDILEKRGRSCIGKAFLKKAEKAAKNTSSEQEILEHLVKSIRMLSKKNGNLYMVYPKCYCHHVKKYKGKIPEYYCNCSVGWIKELFKTALGREVNVKIISTILWGASECKFRIDV